MFVIERLGFDRKSEIMDFEKVCFSSDIWKEEDWNELLNDEKAFYYAMLECDRIIGNVFIYNWKGEKDYIKIMNIAVHPDYRGQGLAHRLLNHITKEMKKCDMKCCCGETRESNKAMQKVFEDCGYKLNKIEQGYYDNPVESAYKYLMQI